MRCLLRFLCLFLACAAASRPAESGAPPQEVKPMSSANRDAGVAPLAVHFDTVDAAAPPWKSGVAQPANGDVAANHYAWDFGDPTSGAWSTSGASRNHAEGFVAAHVYEKPGRYRVRLTVTDPSGKAKAYGQEIRVEPFVGSTIFVSSSAGNDAADGMTEATPWKTLEKALAGLQKHKRLLLRRGDTFTLEGPKRIDVPGPGLIATYGTGASPVIKVSGGGGAFGLCAADWRLQDLELVGPGPKDEMYGVFLDPNRQIDYSLMLRLTIRNFRVGIGWSTMPSITATPPDGTTIVDCSITKTIVNGMFVGGRRLTLLGNTVRDMVESHVARVWLAHKSVISHNVFANPGGTRHSLKLHGPGFGSGSPETKYVVVSDNTFSGTVWAVTVGPEDQFSDQRISFVVLERNRTVALQALQADFLIQAQDVTVRNNLLVGTGSSKYYVAVYVLHEGIVPAPARIRVLNNTVFKGDAGAEFTVCSVPPDATDVLVRNNLGTALKVPKPEMLTGKCAGLVADHNHLGEIVGIPDPKTGGFEPPPESPVRNAGVASPYVRTDHKGRPRASEKFCDLGAFEAPRKP